MHKRNTKGVTSYLQWDEIRLEHLEIAFHWNQRQHRYPEGKQQQWLKIRLARVYQRSDRWHKGEVPDKEAKRMDWSWHLPQGSHSQCWLQIQLHLAFPRQLPHLSQRVLVVAFTAWVQRSLQELHLPLRRHHRGQLLRTIGQGNLRKQTKFLQVPAVHCSPRRLSEWLLRAMRESLQRRRWDWGSEWCVMT